MNSVIVTWAGLEATARRERRPRQAVGIEDNFIVGFYSNLRASSERGRPPQEW
jgi:hypothetical protein